MIGGGSSAKPKDAVRTRTVVAGARYANNLPGALRMPSQTRLRHCSWSLFVAWRRLPGRIFDRSTGLLDILTHAANRVAAERGYAEGEQ